MSRDELIDAAFYLWSCFTVLYGGVLLHQYIEGRRRRWYSLSVALIVLATGFAGILDHVLDDGPVKAETRVYVVRETER